MKLIITIIDSNDEHNLLEKLTASGFMATRMASEGGFLRKKSVTLYIGLEKEKLNNALDIIRECCISRAPLMINYAYHEIGMGITTPYPISEREGGAIVFVIDIDQFEKI